MTKSIMADFVDELVELIQRYDYIMGQYENEDAEVVKPFRKIQRNMMSEATKLQGQLIND